MLGNIFFNDDVAILRIFMMGGIVDPSHQVRKCMSGRRLAMPDQCFMFIVLLFIVYVYLIIIR